MGKETLEKRRDTPSKRRVWGSRVGRSRSQEWDGVPEPTTGSSLPPALSRATPAKAGAGFIRGERLLTSGTAPPFSPISWGGRALPQ